MEKDKPTDDELFRQLHSLMPEEQEQFAAEIEGKLCQLVWLTGTLRAVMAQEGVTHLPIQVNDPLADEPPEYVTFTEPILQRLDQLIEDENRYCLALGYPTALPAIRQAFRLKQERRENL